MRADIKMIERVSEQLVDILGDDFDPETFWDSLDGETDAMDIIGRLVRDREESKAYAEAAKSLADEYASRARRLNERASVISSALGIILDATGQRKVTHPLATVSRTAGRLSCHITDETAIPSQLTVTTVKPDTAAIKKQLEAGETVPGAELVRGADGVTVRVK
jgi:hypothetical protein